MTTPADIKNYKKYGAKKGSAIFADALTENLRQRFPKRQFDVGHREDRDESGTDCMNSAVYEVVGKRLWVFNKKRLVAYLWAGHIPFDCRNGISIAPTDLKTVVEEEAAKLNEISGADKEIFYD